MDNFKFYVFTRAKLGIKADNCFHELTQAHGKDAPSRATVFRWYSLFKNDDKADDDSGCASGRPRITRTVENIRAVEEMINNDCRLSVRDLEQYLDIPKSTVHEILTEDLSLRNVSSVWIPHNLSQQNRISRVDCARHIRELYFAEGLECLCSKLAVQDETWVYLKGQRNKLQNRAWIRHDQARPQVVRRGMSDRKVMLLVAFTPSGRFSISAMPPGVHVDSTRIIDFVRRTGDLWRQLRSQPIHLNELLWQWDNARPHSAQSVKEFMQRRGITTVFQSPYSPDLNLCDRFLFNWMKSDFADKEFNGHMELEQAALQWARQLDREALKREVQKLVDYCLSVIEQDGNYVTP